MVMVALAVVETATTTTIAAVAVVREVREVREVKEVKEVNFDQNHVFGKKTAIKIVFTFFQHLQVATIETDKVVALIDETITTATSIEEMMGMAVVEAVVAVTTI